MPPSHPSELSDSDREESVNVDADSASVPAQSSSEPAETVPTNAATEETASTTATDPTAHSVPEGETSPTQAETTTEPDIMYVAAWYQPDTGKIAYDHLFKAPPGAQQSLTHSLVFFGINERHRLSAKYMPHSSCWSSLNRTCVPAVEFGRDMYADWALWNYNDVISHLKESNPDDPAFQSLEVRMADKATHDELLKERHSRGEDLEIKPEHSFGENLTGKPVHDWTVHGQLCPADWRCPEQYSVQPQRPLAPLSVTLASVGRFFIGKVLEPSFTTTALPSIRRPRSWLGF